MHASCYFTFFVSGNVDVLHLINADNGNIGSSPAVPTTLASAVVASERFTSESVIHKPEKCISSNPNHSYQYGKNSSIVTTDWSRNTRKHLKALSASNNSHKITKYLPIVNQIDQLILENKKTFRICDRILENHPYGRILHIK